MDRNEWILIFFDGFIHETMGKKNTWIFEAGGV
jgi:hypothetical protein